MAGNLYFDPDLPNGFSTLKQLHDAVRDSKIQKTIEELTAWTESQDAFTLHRTVRKRFPRIPDTVNNIMDFWEYDLFDVRGSVNITRGKVFIKC